MTTTAKEVAEWMVNELEGWRYLNQTDAAARIRMYFGEEFIYVNRRRNPAIIKAVLAEFEKLTQDSVVWVRKSRRWRKREEGDAPGREQRSSE
jgi:hypothetical protein